MLQVQNENFDVEDIYLQYKGEAVKSAKSLMEVYTLHNDRMKKLVGIEYSSSTLKKFEESKNHVKTYIRNNYEKSNILLEQLKMKFLNDFDYYLKVEKKLKQVTINKHIERLRKIIKLALAERFLERDPFLLFKQKQVILQVVYLDNVELKLFEEHQFKQKRLQQVADMFIFCCYTGLPYREIAILKKENLINGIIFCGDIPLFSIVQLRNVLSVFCTHWFFLNVQNACGLNSNYLNVHCNSQK